MLAACPLWLTGEHSADSMLGWIKTILQFHLKYSWLNSFRKIKELDHSLTISAPLSIPDLNAHV